MPQLINEERLRGEIFLEPDEKLLCVVGSKQLEAYLESGRRRKCFAVLSDRAVYCKGKCTVSRDRRYYQTGQTDFRLDLEEFKDLKYLQKKNKVLLSLTFFFLLLGPVLLLLDKITNYGDGIAFNPILDAVISLLFAGVFFLLYSIHQRTLLELLHTNGSISLDQRWLPRKEERLLIRYLRAFLKSREEPEPAEEEFDLDSLDLSL
ncbi:MAG: hypothetical protein IKS27_08270 [Oscillospiraceae bacterium]|nr:hypothetical protein [Oscillospiraceae bacterium]